MRGSRGVALLRAGAWGIIPAHAGLTPVTGRGTSGYRDHPRACGAHLRRFPFRSQARGSSPRMRGSPRGLRRGYGSQGIIPAHAGLTDVIDPNMQHERDHPRACGAHFVRSPIASFKMGSSPRMRGSPLAVSRQSDPQGIIPAHAGLTSCSQSGAAAFRDHPRACGAHLSPLMQM